MQAYIHVPFCSSRCKYCRFASSNLDTRNIKVYFKYLEREINNFNLKTEKLNTIYFGWGTPTSVDFSYIKNILVLLKNKFWFSKNIEITLETTPQNITENNLILWQKSWINRISMWLQSLNNNTLKEIWRENKEVILNNLNLLKKSKFKNINIDFILWLPHEKPWEKLNQIKFILKNYKKIKHISVYMLENYNYPKSWDNIRLSEDDFNSEYNEINLYLKQNDFDRYELSNFAIKNYECKHNIWYWEHKNYIWFWLGSHSFIDNTRFNNSDNFKEYYQNISENLEKNKEFLTKNNIILEKILFQIRGNWIEKKYFKYLDEEKIDNFIKLNMLKISRNKLKITEKSFSLVDYILWEIIL